jgi:hypothetical protein
MSKEKLSIIFSILVFAIFGLAALEAQNFRELARFFPFYIAIMGAIVVLADLIVQLRRRSKSKKPEKALHENLPAALKYLLIIIGYLVLIYIFGIFIGTAIYLFCFLYFETKFGLIKSIISVAIVIGFIMLFGDVMNLYWPKNLLGL